MISPTSGLRTWIEISAQAIKNNIQLFRSVVKSTKIMAVVKSNAYGHGLSDYSAFVAKEGIDMLGVDSITEASQLRADGLTLPILVLGFTLPERVAEAVEKNIAVTVSSFESLQTWVDLGLSKKIAVHIKVDTGLHRQGFLFDQMTEVVSLLKKHSDVFFVEGLYTHFAEAKDPIHRTYTEKQIAEFKLWQEVMVKEFPGVVTHGAASGGAMLYPESHFDMVRIGAGLYGIWPSAEIYNTFSQTQPLTSVLTWKTIISEIKKLPVGSAIGYNCTEILKRDSTIAVCPVGYWHGFSRNLSSKGEVLVHGQKAKVLGLVSMDMIVIDITDIPNVAVLDEVVLIGKQNEAEITASDIAQQAGTSAYEFLTRLNPRIKKIYR